jgi:hypothetical protein
MILTRSTLYQIHDHVTRQVSNNRKNTIGIVEDFPERDINGIWLKGALSHTHHAGWHTLKFEVSLLD